MGRNLKKYQSFFFLSENFQFLEVKFSIYLKRRVFVRWSIENFPRYRISPGKRAIGVGAIEALLSTVWETKTQCLKRSAY